MRTRVQIHYTAGQCVNTDNVLTVDRINNDSAGIKPGRCEIEFVFFQHSSEFRSNLGNKIHKAFLNLSLFNSRKRETTCISFACYSLSRATITAIQHKRLLAWAEWEATKGTKNKHTRTLRLLWTGTNPTNHQQHNENSD